MHIYLRLFFYCGNVEMWNCLADTYTLHYTLQKYQLLRFSPLNCPVLKKVYTYNNKNVSKIKIKYYV